jgi:CHAP domain
MKRLFFILLLSVVAFAQSHLDTAKSYVGVRELTGNNDGVEIEKFLSSVGLKKGNAWCAAFISYCLEVNNIKVPSVRSGLARHFQSKVNKKYIVDAKLVLRGKKIPKGSLVIWQKGVTVFGHVGMVQTNWIGQYGKTIEGNTSSGKKGSQSDGDGVYERDRKISPLNYFRIRWFTLVQEEINRINFGFIKIKPLTTFETLKNFYALIL